MAEQPRTARSSARLFGLGAACGFVAGALVVAAIVSKYGTAIGAPPSQPLPASGAVRADDGMADVDSPVLEEALVPAPAPAPTSGAVTAPPTTSPERSSDPTATIVPPSPDELRDRGLEVPVEGIKVDQLVRSFEDRRSGTRAHEAIDILAPRNTPVKAVDDGTIARLFYSKQGGITIYQFDPSETVLLLLRPPGTVRRRAEGGRSRQERPGHRLRRHFWQCPEKHPTPPFCGLPPHRRQAVVGRDTHRPLRNPQDGKLPTFRAPPTVQAGAGKGLARRRLPPDTTTSCEVAEREHGALRCGRHRADVRRYD